MKQRSPEWFNAKLGRVSPSNFSAVLAKGKGTTRRNYLIRLAAERVTGVRSATFSNSWMDRGTGLEAEALSAYKFFSGYDVQEVGFIPMNDDIGGSPDGLINDDGGVEIKCPKDTTHIEYVRKGKAPTTYIPQIQGYMMITGRAWWDFVSYHPDMVKAPKLFIKRVERDDAYIKNLEAECYRFVDDLNKYIASISQAA